MLSMVVPQKRTNATKGIVPETVIAAVTTTNANGDAMSHSSSVQNNDDDDLMTSPSKSLHHKVPQSQKHRFFRSMIMWLVCRHNRSLATNRRKSQQLFLRFTLLLLALVMLSSIFLGRSTKQLLRVDQTPSHSLPTKNTSATRHRPSKHNRTQMLPRLRKRWIGNPFQSKKDGFTKMNPSPPPQQQKSQGLVRLWEKLWQQRYRADQQHMQETQERNHNIFQNSNHTITRLDLTDLTNKHHLSTGQNLPLSNRTTTIPLSSSSSSTILDMVQQRMGLQIDSEIASLLPTWEQVTALYGRQPIIYGINTHSPSHRDHEVCRTYRNRMNSLSPQQQRYVGVAGQMNTGTNALAKYLLQNIYLPFAKASTVVIDAKLTTAVTKNRPSNGILWTVPWYKHSWSSLYQQYHYDDRPHQKTATATEPLPTDHSHVMAIVLIRDPYFWMQSMCGSPYSLEWQRNTAQCPNLFNTESLDMFSSSSSFNNNVPTEGSQVRIRWGPTGNYIRTWPSLVEMYNEWYNEYVVNTQNMSRIIIRFEDLLFHTEFVINAIRECVNAKWIHTTNVTSTTSDENGHGAVVVEERPIFQYAVSPAKTHPYFSKYKPPSSYVSALIKYGQDNIDGRNRYGSMTPADIEYAQTHLNPELLRLFHYQINPSGGVERNGR